MTGTLPQVAQQNVFLGLPLQLLPQEVVLLVEKGKLCLVAVRRCRRIIVAFPEQVMPFSSTIKQRMNYQPSNRFYDSIR